MPRCPWPYSVLAVGAEVWVSVLVEDSHDEEPVIQDSMAVDVAAHASLIGTSANMFEPIAWAESLVGAAIAADLPRLPRLLCACGYSCFVGRPVTAAAHAEHAMRLEHDPSYESCEPGLAAFIAALANVYAGRLDRYVEFATIADATSSTTPWLQHAKSRTRSGWRTPCGAQA